MQEHLFLSFRMPNSIPIFCIFLLIIMRQKEGVSLKSLGIRRPRKVLKRNRKKGACLPLSYITFLLPTLTNGLGSADSKRCFCLIPSGRVTAVSLWSEGQLYSKILRLIYMAALQSRHSRRCDGVATSYEKYCRTCLTFHQSWFITV